MLKYLLVLALILFPRFSFGFGVDLHAHLFMSEGVNGIFFGNFFSPKILASKWNHAKRSQVNEELLKNSSLSIVVISLYAAPLLAGEKLFNSINEQINQAELFVKKNPNWVIAHSSKQAKEALQNGKKVLILSIEGAANIITTPRQIDFLYQRGVRIVTLLHLTADELGYPAFIGAIESIFTIPGASLFCFDRDDNYVRINCKGLTTRGREVADRLISAGIWIDLSHSSDKALDELIPIHYEKNLPLLFTHASLRTKLGQERGVSSETLKHYQHLGGIFGLVPSKKLLGKTENCSGTVDAFTEHYIELKNYLSPDQIAIGTDTNGMINHIKPRDPKEACNKNRTYTSFDRQGGWWNFSHTGSLWAELKRIEENLPAEEMIVDRFLSEWARVEAIKNGHLDDGHFGFTF